MVVVTLPGRVVVVVVVILLRGSVEVTRPWVVVGARPEVVGRPVVDPRPPDVVVGRPVVDGRPAVVEARPDVVARPPVVVRPPLVVARPPLVVVSRPPPPRAVVVPLEQTLQTSVMTELALLVPASLNLRRFARVVKQPFTCADLEIASEAVSDIPTYAAALSHSVWVSISQ